jgi:hypothetical protein
MNRKLVLFLVSGEQQQCHRHHETKKSQSRQKRRQESVRYGTVRPSQGGRVQGKEARNLSGGAERRWMMVKAQSGAVG